MVGAATTTASAAVVSLISTSAIAIRQDMVILALDFQQRCPFLRHNALPIIGRRKSVQHRIDGRIEREEIDHNKGIEISWNDSCD